MFSLKPADQAVKDYYFALEAGSKLQIDHELGVRHAFETLLDQCARRFYGWTLAREHTIRRASRILRPDGTVLDEFRLSRGWYEAKDAGANLAKEARDKLAQGYPRQNMLFWQPGRILLYQGAESDFDINEPARLISALQRFFEHEEPDIERWEVAVREFKDRVPELAQSLSVLIHREEKGNHQFRAVFNGFVQLCRAALNPNLSPAAVEEMLIQHLLTERIFAKVFDNPDFTRRNVIAIEIEKVIQALTVKSFSRNEFLKNLDPFYKAIETTAAGIEDYSQKQGFLNTVYEKFFQGFSVKSADTHGIVYTPQSIVDFMVESVDELLTRELGMSLSTPGVHVIDPFVGTGNFLIRVLRQIAESKKSALPEKYARELHANEVMLLPYYIASMNIEHTYLELTGRYQSFAGICLVDTFGLAEPPQMSMFAAANTERVERQKLTPVSVVIGNPPYNVGQVNENDNNKNRKYPALDKDVRETFARASRASSTSKLDDPYIKAIRWAMDRIGSEGLIAFVCNNGFLDGIATDGVRKHLEEGFDTIYILDLGGNVRKNPKLSGTIHNVFGIQVGVSLNFFVRRRQRSSRAEIFYFRMEETWRKEEKSNFLAKKGKVSAIDWQRLEPDAWHTWLREGVRREFETFKPLGTKSAPVARKLEGVLFRHYSLGVTTNRDTWAYNFNRDMLAASMKRMIGVYNDHVDRWPMAEREGQKIDDWVEQDGQKIAWSRDLKVDVTRGKRSEYTEASIRRSLYRPFSERFLYYDSILNEEPRSYDRVFPETGAETENRMIVVSDHGHRAPFSVLAVSSIPECHLCAPSDAFQGFPFYTYEGGFRRENLTDWALQAFQERYSDPAVTKWDIFHYIYGLLHHPTYRERYAANLKRELPRIPFAPEFHPLAEAGARLAELHVNYETRPEFPVLEIWRPGTPLDLRVKRMKHDSAAGEIVYNEALTLKGIPREVELYRLGHKSALGWVIDQYRVTTDKRSGIVNDPNREDDPKAILRLIGQVIWVSLETVRIVKALPALGLAAAD